jgi:cyanate lyase
MFAAIVVQSPEHTFESRQRSHVICKLAMLFMQLKHETLDYLVFTSTIQRVDQCVVTETYVGASLKVKEVRQIEALLSIDEETVRDLLII